MTFAMMKFIMDEGKGPVTWTDTSTDSPPRNWQEGLEAQGRKKKGGHDDRPFFTSRNEGLLTIHQTGIFYFSYRFMLARISAFAASTPSQPSVLTHLPASKSL